MLSIFNINNQFNDIIYYEMKIYSWPSIESIIFETKRRLINLFQEYSSNPW